MADFGKKISIKIFQKNTPPRVFGEGVDLQLIMWF